MSDSSNEDSAAYKRLCDAFPFKPPSEVPKGVLYHYCSSDTFHAIVTNKTIRSSDLSKMNDFRELSWGLDLAKDEISEHRGIISDNLSDLLLDRVDYVNKNARLLISCFSLEGDILSQWRAYAEDAKGFSIGFDSAKISKCLGKMGKVLYKEEEQRAELKNRLINGGNLFHQCPESQKNKMALRIATQLLTAACYMKNSAFSEEKEVRSTRAVVYIESEKGFDISSPGGKEIDIKFSIRGGQLVPYADRTFGDQSGAIKKVILGPKNSNSESDVKAFLSFSSLTVPEVSRSAASYR
ncbi:DUF2971 domain-containing protein [Brevundimonas sp. Root1423]|uniref:DUF2971 domain-containing protein n=1 Tax=Brevundimonas sp. Root1423 TaxID=1736462 RepID=UPI0009EB73DF|nr:DUF2971 domain-containing protein [Brevundimonas sp. Root1423]